jgi:uncharacterized BrkB/YihY/UPF0761 family membrane protein
VPAVRAAREAADRASARALDLPWAPRAIESFEREQRSGAGLLAGGLAYRLFFWLVAFGLLVAATASFWVRSSEASMEDAAKSFGLSGVATQSAASAVRDGSNARWYLLVSGLVLVAYFGLGAVRALRVAAFIAWQMKPTRLRKPTRASAMFTGLFVLGLTATTLMTWVRHHSGVLGLVVTIGALAGYVALAVVVFDLLPHPSGITWRSQLPGAVLAAAGLTALHVFVVYYLSGKLERSPKLYGTLGAATVVLLGLYLIARVLVSAMFLNATLAHARGSPDAGDDEAQAAFDALSSSNG